MTTPHYRAQHFSGVGTLLEAVSSDGVVHLLQAGCWTIGECREYAAESGYTVERIALDSPPLFIWHRPEDCP